MEGDLHVEVSDAVDGGEDAREAAAPLGPGEGLVVARDDGGDGVLPRADGLLERGPPVGVLERPVGAGGHEDVGGDGSRSRTARWSGVSSAARRGGRWRRRPRRPRPRRRWTPPVATSPARGGAGAPRPGGGARRGPAAPRRGGPGCARTWTRPPCPHPVARR